MQIVKRKILMAVCTIEQLHWFAPAFVIILTSTLFARTLSVQGAEFHIAGKINIERPFNKQRTEVDSFDVFFRTNNWLIRVHQISWSDAPKNAELFDYSSFHIGSNVFTTAYPTPKTIQRIISDPSAPRAWKEHPEQQAFSLAWVDHSHVPYADLTPALQVLYYTFCSGSYLDGVVGSRLEPPYYVDGQVYSFSNGLTNVPAKISRSTSPPHLPTQIVFLHGDTENIGPSALVKAREGLAGVTNAIFNADEFTNISGIYIPMRFQLNVISEMVTNGVIKFVPNLEVSGQVQLANSYFALSNLECSLKSPAVFADKRFSSDGSALVVRYVARRWLTAREVMGLSEFKAAQLQHQIDIRRVRDRHVVKRSSGHIWAVVVIVVAALSILPLLFAGRKSRGSRAN